jgi:hypothetical protein
MPQNALHSSEREKLEQLVKENKNVFVSGAPGVGKTHLIKSVLEGTKYFDLDSHTTRFYYLCRDGVSHIFIDNYEDDISFKKIVDEVSEGHRKTNGAFIVESQKFHLFPNFENITLNKLSVEELLSLTDKTKDYTDIATKCDGNIRDFMTYKDFLQYEKDKFFTTKEYITDVLCGLHKINTRDVLQEHGNFWSTIHENYLESDGCVMNKVMNSLSFADSYDNSIYDGNWDSMKFFVNEVVSIPKFYFGKGLEKDKIRPGSSWSKAGNQKMRRRKIAEILQKGPPAMHKEHLHVLKLYAQNGNIDILKEYNITPQDFDIINHICIQNKLKQRDVNNIKKCLRN